jgi:hypothetical protein
MSTELLKLTRIQEAHKAGREEQVLHKRCTKVAADEQTAKTWRVALMDGLIPQHCQGTQPRKQAAHLKAVRVEGSIQVRAAHFVVQGKSQEAALLIPPVVLMPSDVAWPVVKCTYTLRISQ